MQKLVPYFLLFFKADLEPEFLQGAALHVLRHLLDEQDPQQHWGGLKKVLTPEGHYLWLCEYHARGHHF
jgi:internalin A